MKRSALVSLIYSLSMAFMPPSSHANILYVEPGSWMRVEGVDIPLTVNSISHDVNDNDPGTRDFLMEPSLFDESGNCLTKPVIEDYLVLATDEGLIVDISGSTRFRPWITDWINNEVTDIFAKNTKPIFMRRNAPPRNARH